MEIQWQEHTIEEIMAYFAQGFEGVNLHKYEWFYDPRVGKVVFKLYVKTDE